MHTNSFSCLDKAHECYLQRTQVKPRDLKSSVKNHFVSNYRSGQQIQAESGAFTSPLHCPVRMQFTSTLMTLHWKGKNIYIFKGVRDEGDQVDVHGQRRRGYHRKGLWGGSLWGTQGQFCLPSPTSTISGICLKLSDTLAQGRYAVISVVSDSLWPYGLCSPPGSSVHGILQARIVEWVATPSSRGSSWPRDLACISCIAGRFLTAKPLVRRQGSISWWNRELGTCEWWEGIQTVATW